jgi:hypothetical protein
VSTSVIEPGTRLAGRYRLEDRVSETGGSTLWKAIDEILARAVAVRTFTPDFPQISAVVTAARAASRLTDPRLTQVFDADDSGELAYVVSEWVIGETLEDMVSAGRPLEPGRAATLLKEAAEAIAAAHAVGLAHLRLTTSTLLWTTGGTVKLLGLGVDAALHGVAVDDPALVDTQGLGHMLYAALTAHTVVAGDGGLPEAPTVEGRPYPPRQLNGAVPPELDTIVRRALGIDPDPGPEPLVTPAVLAKALGGVPRTPLPLFAGPATGPVPTRRRDTAPPSPQASRPTAARAATGPTTTVPAAVPFSDAEFGESAPGIGHGSHRMGGADRTGRVPVNRRLITVAAAAATAVVIGVGGWQLTHDGDGRPSASRTKAPATAAPAASAKLTIASATGFDPTRSDHPDPTAQSTGKYAVDDSATTAWHTQRYASANFGMLKDGLGVLLDMGKPVKVEDVRVTLPGGGGTLQLRVGNSADLNALKVVASSPGAVGKVDLKPAETAEGQYVLLWFTKLPSDFKAQVSDVDVLGSTG